MPTSRHVTRACAFSLLLCVAVSCSAREPANIDSVLAAVATGPVLPPGEATLVVNGGRIWYKTTGTGSGIPVILIHGGPGFGSNYFKPLEALGDDRRVTRYDQLGSGKSDRVHGTSSYTIDRFVRELDSLRSHLHYDRVHLLGHSWGTIVALEYYRAHPEHVASLTMASAFIDLPTWKKNGRQLIQTLSPKAQRAIAKHEIDQQYDAPDYQAAVKEYDDKYLVRRPVAADMDSALKSMDDSAYNYMQGPSEFTITGTLKRYDGTGFLNGIRVPVLYTVGEFDEASPATVKGFAAITPGARLAVIPNSAHITMWDNGPAMLDAVRTFLRAVDSTTKR